MNDLFEFLTNGDKEYRDNIIKKLENNIQLTELEIDYITDYVSTYSRFIERRREKCKEITKENTKISKN